MSDNTETYRFRTIEQWLNTKQKLKINDDEIFEIVPFQAVMVNVALYPAGIEKMKYEPKEASCLSLKMIDLAKEHGIYTEDIQVNTDNKTLSFYALLCAENEFELIRKLNQRRIKSQNICGITTNANYQGVRAVIYTEIDAQKEIDQKRDDEQAYFSDLGLFPY